MPKAMRISIVIPAYNSQDWIEPTVRHIDEAVARSGFDVDLVLVDDGSTDDTLARMKSLRPECKRLHVTVVAQKNEGRYVARKVGVEKTTSDHILFIDSRVFIEKDALKYLESKLASDPDQVWNGHVHVDKKGNMFARFWDAIVCIAWRRYFAHPKETSFGIKDFDYYPKGTGFFFVPKKLLLEAMATFETQTNDIKFSSDDTLLIRFIAARTPIHLSPEFSCLYHGRSNLRAFLKHAYNRGQFFVDGFFRPGNRFFIPLLGFLGLTILVLVALVIWPIVMLKLLVAALILGVLGLFLGAFALRVEWRDALSLAVLSPFFAVVYGAGIWRGVARKYSAKQEA